MVEACLISSLFHDTGLTITLDENHGKESKNICNQYFDENKIPKPENFEDILFAIENHDDKNYKSNYSEPNSVLSILCNADDLDAFGRIGIIRYTEIYLMRGIKLNKLSQLVLKNLENRFLNFERIYKDFTPLYTKHKERYHLIKKFFEELNSETI